MLLVLREALSIHERPKNKNRRTNVFLIKYIQISVFLIHIIVNIGGKDRQLMKALYEGSRILFFSVSLYKCFLLTSELLRLSSGSKYNASAIITIVMMMMMMMMMITCSLFFFSCFFFFFFFFLCFFYTSTLKKVREKKKGKKCNDWPLWHVMVVTAVKNHNFALLPINKVKKLKRQVSKNGRHKEGKRINF